VKILDRYVAREMIVPFLFGTVAFVTVFVAGSLLLRLTTLMAQEGATVGEAALLFMYWLPRFIVPTFPMATLLAVLLAFGRLAGDSELSAIRAAGVSFARLLVPALVIAALISGAAILINESVVPPAERAGENLLLRISASERRGTRQDVIIRQMQGGQVRQLVYARGFEPGAAAGSGATGPSLLTTVDVLGLGEDGRADYVVTADQLRWDQARGSWRFSSDAVLTIMGPHGETISASPLRKSTLDIELPAFRRSPQDILAEQRTPEEMTYAELRGYLDRLKGAGADVAALAVQLNQKLAIPFATLVFALIGAPLSLRGPRSSSSLGLAFAVLIIICYYLIWNTLAVMGQRGLLAPWLAAWLPNIITGGAGLALVANANR
jgi:lipopolysaccharide export system permease protein